MRLRPAILALVVVLLLLPASSALACMKMLEKADACPMEPENTQPAPNPAKASCCYLSAAEPMTGAAPFKFHKVAAVLTLPVLASLPSTQRLEAPVSLHGLSPGHSSSFQELYCVFLI